MAPKSTSFTAERINSTTFLIIEDDSWGERPRIYALVHPRLHVLVLSDTGCDSPRDRSVRIPHLRAFLETVSIASNNNSPLNPGPNHRAYIILCTHCHYDHIGGIEQFAPHQSSSTSSVNNSNAPVVTILASANGRQFIEQDLPTHSLCKALGIRTPIYKITHWAQDHESLLHTPPLSPTSNTNSTSPMRKQQKQDLDLTILQTPGHTPDSLSWYDGQNRHIYIGDTAYELGDDEMPIIFPREGDWSVFMTSLAKLVDFVLAENAISIAEGSSPAESPSGSAVEESNKSGVEGDENDAEDWLLVPGPLKLSAAHTTTSVDAFEFLSQVYSFFSDVVAGEIPIQKQWVQRGEVYCLWTEQGKNTGKGEEKGKGKGKGKDKGKGEARFAVQAPRRLWEDIRKERGLDGALKERPLKTFDRNAVGRRWWDWGNRKVEKK